MNIAVIFGSPKGKMSLSQEYARFIVNNFDKEHNFQEFFIGRNIDEISKNEQLFSEIIRDITKCDAILWATPVYYTTVPVHLQRFINMVYSKDLTNKFTGLHSALITTSINFFDHTAQEYIKAVTEDWHMNHIDSFSIFMSPYFPKANKGKIIQFFNNFINAAEQKAESENYYYKPGIFRNAYTPGFINSLDKTEKIKAVIVTDSKDEESNINLMIKSFIKQADYPVKVLNIHDKYIKNGCTACFGCVIDNKCIIQDEFMSFYKNEIMSSDLVIFAAEIQNRFISDRFKMFFDRTFFNNHIPSLSNKQAAVLLSGEVKNSPYIKDCFEGILQFNGANVNGYVTDEYSESDKISRLLKSLSEKMKTNYKTTYVKPDNYLGIGAKKIFRDFIYIARFPLYADFKHYKKNVFQGLPHKLKFPVLVGNLSILRFRLSGKKKAVLQNALKQMFNILKANLVN